VGEPIRKTVAAAVHPLTGGAAHFNGGMIKALAERGPVDVISWRRLYPPFLYSGQTSDHVSEPPFRPEAVFLLDCLNPLSWRKALARLREFESQALVLPWLHPVLAPPYSYLLRRAPRDVARVVICHNVVPHEPLRGGAALTRAVLRHADLFVVHASRQREELAGFGLADIPVLKAFHPRFVASDLAPEPGEEERAAERRRQGNPELSLIMFGAVRPYKGVDLALKALALVDPALHVRLTVAGKFWEGGAELRQQAEALGLNGRLELRDGFVPNEEAALLFAAADASLLPYRSASQSGVVQLSFAHGRPVIATRVGGLPAAVSDGSDGLLCDPEPASIARAIERMAQEKQQLAAGVRADAHEHSFARYAELLDGALGEARN
jgi:glycosyltransferase involved in cell wall biosynthesis